MKKVLIVTLIGIFALVFTSCKKETPVIPKKEVVKLTAEEYILNLNSSLEVVNLKRGELLIKVVGDQTVATSEPILVIRRAKDSCRYGYLVPLMKNVPVKYLQPFWIAPESKARLPIEGQRDFSANYDWYENYYILGSIVMYGLGDTTYYVADGKFVGK